MHDQDSPTTPAPVSSFSTGRVMLGVLGAAAGMAGYASLALLGWSKALARGVAPEYVLGHGPSLAVILPLLLLALSCWWAFRRGFGPNLLVRSIWWSSLLVGTLVAMSFRGLDYRMLGVGIALSLGAALLVLGRQGLDRGSEGGPFAPAAYRNLLMLALILAVADAQNLLFWGAGLLNAELWLPHAYTGGAWMNIMAGAVMVVAVWGLYHLRTWALLLNMAANVVIAGLAVNGVLGLPNYVGAALYWTAALQLLLPVPLVAAALGDRIRKGPRFFGMGPRLVRLSILGLMLWATVWSVLPGKRGIGWMESTYRTTQRGVVWNVPRSAPRPATAPGA